MKLEATLTVIIPVSQNIMETDYNLKPDIKFLVRGVAGSIIINDFV